MYLYIHIGCGQPAVETPDVYLQELPPDFPFTCLSCLEEIEDESDVKVVERMSQ